MVIDSDKNRKESIKRILEETTLTPIRLYNGKTLWTTNPDVFPIEGLFYDPDFLSAKEQQLAVDTVDSGPFSSAISRRQQFWGETYYHTTHDLKAIQPSPSPSPNQYTPPSRNHEPPTPPEQTHPSLPLNKFQWLIDKFDSVKMEGTHPGTYTYQKKTLTYESTPPGLFINERVTQILVNEYTNFQGISHHLDDPYAFGHVLVMVSLVSPIYMTLTLARGRTKVLLEPGSLLVMKGEARYGTVHGITRQKWLVMPDGGLLERGEGYRRLSLTVRQLLEGRKKVQADSDGWLEVGEKISV